MVEIKETSYKDERLGFFADQRKLVQKRYDRLEKAIKPDEPYMSERRQFLSDCGRELNFYNDVIEMLENGVVSKSEVTKIFVEIETDLRNAIRTVKECGLNEAIKKAKLECYEEDMLGYIAELKKQYK